MLAPRAPSAFVCLRCEAQLLRPRLPAFPPRTAHSNFSSSARRHDGEEHLETPTPAQQSKLKITREVEPLDQIRRRRGKVVRETSARLGGLKRLGSDAEILVLREVGVPTQENHEQALDTAEPLEAVNIVDGLQQEAKALTPEESYEQIESLRPRSDAQADLNEPHYITQTVFLKLTKLLTAGFTQRQLAAYYSNVKNLEESNVYKGVIDSIKMEGAPASRPIDRSDWHPGTRPIAQRLPGLDVHVRSWKKPVSKQLLVDRILRDLWKLVLLEEIEAPGELEIFLKSWQFRLLNGGDNETILDRIGRTRKAKLDFFKEHYVLRFTADKSTAEYAANDVEEALQSTETIQMDLQPYVPLLAPGKIAKGKSLFSMYSNEDIDILSRSTRTSIEIGTNNMLTIRGLDKAAIDEARRSLVNLLPLKDATTRIFDTQKIDAKQDSSYLLPVFLEEKSLDHKFRKTPLGRRSMPIVRLVEPEPEPETTNDPAQEQKVADKPGKSPKTFHGLMNRVVASVRRPTPEALERTGAAGGWSSKPDFQLSVELGQVLFPLKHSNPSKAVDAASKDPFQSPFLPHFPGLNTLLASPDLSTTSRAQDPSLVYEFRPSLDQSEFPVGQMFPSLRVQMRTGVEGDEATLHKLSLRFDHRIHDVLLPGKATDIRFSRYGRLLLGETLKEKNVQEWVAAVVENIQSGGRLTAPPLCIDVPEWTIPGLPTDAQGMRSVKYDFAGVQFRQTVIGQLHGTSISYSTTQSGKLRARSGALTAHYNSGNSVSDEQLHDEVAIKAFVRKCFTMVDKITEASSQTVPVSRMPRMPQPRNEYMSRKMKRSGLQQAASESAKPRVSAEAQSDKDRSRQILQQNLSDEGTAGAVVEEAQQGSTLAQDEHHVDTNVQPIADDDIHDTLRKDGAALSEPEAQPIESRVAAEEVGIDDTKDQASG